MHTCLDSLWAGTYTGISPAQPDYFAQWSSYAPSASHLFPPALADGNPAKLAADTERTQVPGLSHHARPMPLCSTRRRRGIVVTLTRSSRDRSWQPRHG